MCAVRERRPELVVHAHGHVMVHWLLLFCACDANHELAETVDTQRSSCSRCASTDSSFSFGDLASGGNGVKVDAEQELSPHPPESVDGAGHEYPFAAILTLSVGLSREAT